MLYFVGADDPLSNGEAEALRVRRPRVVRHTRAWVDDSELCLEVECVLSDGTIRRIEMQYSWDACGKSVPWSTSPLYFMEVTAWLLNGNLRAFYNWVQQRFGEELDYHATNDYFAEFDEPAD